MLSSEELLLSLYRRGVRLWAEDGHLRYQAPKGTLHREELEGLRARKSELIELLGRSALHLEAPLGPRPPGCVVPLTRTQLHWWSSANRMQQGFGQRLVYVATRISGTLDVELLRRVIQLIVQRHEALRTTIVTAGDGTPRQQIDAGAQDPLTVTDLRAVPAAQAEPEVTRRVEELVRANVRLDTGPLFAADLFVLPAHDYVLVLAIEHVIADGVSIGILHGEIWRLYRQGVLGLPLSLPPLTVQFADYAVWQERTYEAWLKSHGAYWRRRLTGAPRTRVPIDAEPAPAQASTYATHVTRFGADLTARLRELARRHRVLLPVVVLAIQTACMARWCRQRELLVLFISSARYRPELERMVGFLANCLHLRLEVREDDTHLSVLERTDAELRAAMEHPDYDRARDLVPGCASELSFNWISQSWLSQSFDAAWQDDTGLTLEPLPLQVPWPRAFLPVFNDTPHGIVANFTYRKELFTAATLQRFGDDMLLLADAFCDNPLARIAATWSKLQ